MKPAITGYDRASLLDLAIISGGGMDCLFEFVSADVLSITDDVMIGRHYNAHGLSAIDPAVLKIVNDENIRPATAISPEDMCACPYGGIGFMGVEIDFEVS